MGSCHSSVRKLSEARILPAGLPGFGPVPEAKKPLGQRAVGHLWLLVADPPVGSKECEQSPVTVELFLRNNYLEIKCSRR